MLVSLRSTFLNDEGQYAGEIVSYAVTRLEDFATVIHDQIGACVSRGVAPDKVEIIDHEKEGNSG